jgi:Glycosyltransferase Family 4
VEDVTLVQPPESDVVGDDRDDRRPRSQRGDGGDGDGDEELGLSETIRTLFDIQALQNRWSAERGIGRHVHQLALALGESPSVQSWYLLNRDLPVPDVTLEELEALGKVAYSADRALPRQAVYRVPSPLEPSHINRVWPPDLRSLPLVVTLHDLIPAMFPAENTPDPGVRRAYWTRLELTRPAARVLSVSRATARDAIRIIGLRPERVVVTGGGLSPEFSPGEPPRRA